MKKQYFILVALVVSCAFTNTLFAQSLQLVEMPGVLDTEADATSEAHIFVKNVSTSTINVIARREQMNLAPQHVSYFCWDVCFGPSGTIGAPISVAPGDTIKAFKSYLEPNGANGLSTVRYSYFVENSESDSVQYTFTYRVGLSGLANELKENLVNVYPNPATNQLFVSFTDAYTTADRLEIADVCGRKLLSQQVNTGMANQLLNLQQFAPGVYILKATQKGLPVTQTRFVVL